MKAADAGSALNAEGQNESRRWFQRVAKENGKLCVVVIGGTASNSVCCPELEKKVQIGVRRPRQTETNQQAGTNELPQISQQLSRCFYQLSDS